MADTHIPICPRCGSISVEILNVPLRDACRNCGFGREPVQAPYKFDNFPTVHISEIEDFKKSIHENPIIRD